MILIPIGRDDAEIRRHAWVSYAIIALNVLAFVATMTAERQSRMMKVNEEWRDALMYNVRHPYLQTPATMTEVLRADVVRYLQDQRKAVAPPAAMVVAREQRMLNELADKAVAAYRRLPTIRFGYIPAEGGVLTLLTSMFIHAGMLHLLGNLLFFYLSGPFVEDVFGRPLFAALYLSGGIVASLTYMSRHPLSTIPLVGASGAIAAVMGAYLVRFFRSKVEFLFIPIIIRPSLHVRFFAPAFVVLPLWFYQQFMELTSEAGGGGVAFSAHVGGFLYGVVIALIVKTVSFEDRYVNPVVKKETTWELGAGSETPDYDRASTRLLTRYAEEKRDDLAMELIRETTSDPTAALPKFFARAASYVERRGDREWALRLYARTLECDPDGVAAVGALVKIGTLLRAKGDLPAARETFAKARAHPACTAEWAPAIDAKIAQCDAL